MRFQKCDSRVSQRINGKDYCRHHGDLVFHSPLRNLRDLVYREDLRCEWSEIDQRVYGERKLVL